MIDAWLDRWTPLRVLTAPRPSADPVDPVECSTDLARWRLRAKSAWLEKPLVGDHAALVADSDESFGRLTSADPGLLDEDAARVFWIHVYNAMVARLVLEYGRRWDLYRRHAVVVAGLLFTADAIEHGVLRANRGHRLLPGPAFDDDDPRRRFVLSLDPRIHAALHCGQESCPPVQVYRPTSLSADLDDALLALLQASTRIDRRHGRCRVHPILYDYRRDFGADRRLVELALRATGEDVEVERLRLARRRPREATAL